MTTQSVIDSITALAAGSLKDHVITAAVGHSHADWWRCGRSDGSSAYVFVVTVIPTQSLLMITGDLGCQVWQRTTDMVEWARSAAPSIDIDYFAEKTVASAKPLESSAQTSVVR